LADLLLLLGLGLSDCFKLIMLYILIFVFGLCVGSFLNVAICRLKTKEPITKSRSHCPKCRAVLKWYDLIPVLSFLIQKGKCRYCHKKISWQYPIIETSTGLIFLQIFNFQFSIFNTIYYFLIISFLIIIFVYDLKHYIIPDRIIYPAILVAGIWYLVSGIFIQNTSYELRTTILSALGASLFFLALVLISQGKWMGLGDVKLAFLMGLILGWPNILLALFLSFFSGAIIGIGLIIAGKKGLKSQIPFGPFLAGSTILVLLYGHWLITCCINFLYGL
jgi:leader peptidase (prepilin peptidase)/N-methyltransferase|tara:strand:- start:2963 stop:3793 length:831 start_codon:yes stop_codon:yes gene_type:complete